MRLEEWTGARARVLQRVQLKQLDSDELQANVDAH